MPRNWREWSSRASPWSSSASAASAPPAAWSGGTPEGLVGRPRTSPLDSAASMGRQNEALPPGMAEASHSFMQGGGAMGAHMRALDWSRTALGDPSGWPQALRTAVRLMLTTGHPMYIFWGPDGICLYNDAYSRSIGPERHPASLGRPAREVWDEIWPIIGPQIAQVMGGGDATSHENALVPITRNGRREDVYWTYSYCPIVDDSAPNGGGGLLVICYE